MRQITIAAVLALAACKAGPPPQEGPAPRYEISTVLGDLESPNGVAVGPEGIYLSTKGGFGVLGPEGQLRTLAPISKPLKGPAGIAVATGSAFLADPPTHRVWRLSALASDGAPEAFAGTGTSLFPIGDGGLAVSAQLNLPSDVAIDAMGYLYIADTGNHRVRRVDPNGRITTVAGDGMARFAGEQVQAIDASLHAPQAIDVGPDGSLYVADTGNHAVRKIAPDGLITTLAGDGTEGLKGDGGPALKSQLASPSGIAILPGGDLLVSDTGNHRIRWLRPGGPIQTVAGSGEKEAVDAAIAAASARLDQPAAISLSPDLTPFFVDRSQGRLYQLRRVEPATASGERSSP